MLRTFSLAPIKLVSRLFRYTQDGVEFSWQPPPGVNGTSTYKCEIIECNAGSFWSVYRPNQTNETKCQFGPHVFNSIIDDRSKFIRIDDVDKTVFPTKLEFRFEG